MNENEIRVGGNPRYFLRATKEYLCDSEGGLTSSLALNEGNSEKNSFRGWKSHISLVQEKAQMEVQTRKQFSLEG